MKVKELRGWLNDFGEKQKQHYKRQQPQFRHDIDKIKTQENDELVIQSKPSNASTSPSSSNGSVSSAENDLFQLTLVPPSTKLIRATVHPKKTDQHVDQQDNRRTDIDQEEDESYYSDPSIGWWSEDESSFEGNEKEFPLGTKSTDDSDGTKMPRNAKNKSTEEFSRRITFGGIQGINTMGSDTMDSFVMKRASLATPSKRTLVIPSQEAADVLSVGVETTGRQMDSKPPKPVFRKKVDPIDLPFLQPKPQKLQKPIVSASDGARKSSVGAAIAKFGGLGGRKTIVEKRKDELERQWSEAKAVTHIKKTKWCVCEKTGVYKKKIVVEAETKVI